MMEIIEIWGICFVVACILAIVFIAMSEKKVLQKDRKVK